MWASVMSKLGPMRLVVGGCLVALVSASVVNRWGRAEDSFSPFVDERGGISVPSDYRKKWVFLGAWSIDAGEDTPGSKGLHNVYTQPGVVEAYRNSGEFPDGTVLIKELLGSKTESMTTGTVSHGVDIEGWFIMVKDTRGRFPENKLWGEGWGWALFGPDGSLKTKDREAECLGCHLPAKDTDWVYVRGYPLLN
jgi:hypothetical protein